MDPQLQPLFEKSLHHWSPHHFGARSPLCFCLDRVTVGIDPSRNCLDWRTQKLSGGRPDLQSGFRFLAGQGVPFSKPLI